MRSQLANFIERSWYSRGGLTLILLPLAWAYGFITWLRRWLYLRDFLQRPQLPVPVIVVGNIAVGGTGKSPVTGWLVHQLAAAGYRPGIVSRGYGGRPQLAPVLLTKDSMVSEVGDEPVMLLQQTGAPVCVCVDRVQAVQELAELGVNVIVADDGLQHYRMRRVAELVVVDGERRYGNGQLLPAGPLREPPSRLAEVDAICVNGASAAAGETSFALEPDKVMPLQGGVSKTLGDFSGVRVWSVAGIGNPQRFHALLRQHGIEVDPVAVEDHRSVRLQGLLAERSQPILMTSKDAVKYSDAKLSDCWYVPVSVVFDAAAAEALMTRLIAKLGSPD